MKFDQYIDKAKGSILNKEIEPPYHMKFIYQSFMDDEPREMEFPSTGNNETDGMLAFSTFRGLNTTIYPTKIGFIAPIYIDTDEINFMYLRMEKSGENKVIKVQTVKRVFDEVYDFRDYDEQDHCFGPWIDTFFGDLN